MKQICMAKGRNKQALLVGRRDRKTLLADLKACKNLENGKEIHAEAIESGNECIYVATALVNMYARCQRMVCAHQVFDSIKHPDAVSWNALILGYAANGKGTIALDMFARMQFQGCSPNSVTFVAALKACTSLALDRTGIGRKECRDRGKQIHAEIGCYLNTYVQTALIEMYAKCGSMIDAHQIFDAVEKPDVVTWTVLILGYAENGDGVAALDLFAKMRNQGCAPDSRTYVAALKSCTSLALGQGENGRAECRKWGKEIHSEIGSHSDIYVQSCMIHMYSICGSMTEARQVFDGIKHPHVVAWNALIMGYAENGEGLTALGMFALMRNQGCEPDSVTFISALKACTFLALKQDEKGKAECREWGKQIHLEIGSHWNTSVQSTLIDMYAKCGCMADAREVFDSIKQPTVVSWTALILGYAENSDGFTALDLFAKMRSQGCAPDSITIVAALKACTSVALDQGSSGRAECRERGKKIHSEIGCHSDIYVQSSLIDMYAKCGSLVDARQVFDSIKQPHLVSWNALILGYAENGDGVTALDLFAKMRSQGCEPDSVTFISALKACISLAVDGEGRAQCRERGKQLHSDIGCHLTTFVQSTLIDVYAKSGSMSEARQVFEEMKLVDVVSCNALILGYAENGQSATALDLFAKMNSHNFVTFIAALKACTFLGALGRGREIHCKIHADVDTGTEFDTTIIVNCLVDFYAKCGSLVEAQELFDSQHRRRNLITWNALMAGYSRMGDNKAVFGLFERIQDAGYKPDGVTFLCILSCCSHAGLVEMANEIFEAMPTTYGITRTVEHYNCMLDNLGRSNRLNDAIVLLQSMPCKRNSVTWMTVLSGCRKWKNVEIGRLAFKSLMCLDDTDGAAYVLMAHIYGSKGMWEEQEMVLGMRIQFKAWKRQGQSSWTNELGEVHTFSAGGNNHRQFDLIQEKLKAMYLTMRENGYVADLLSINSNVTNAEKEEALCAHSEKLALACALVNTGPGETIRILKNLRVCDDCHTIFVLISKLEYRTIICRDASRFHIFRDGKCSCGDFW